MVLLKNKKIVLQECVNIPRKSNEVSHSRSNGICDVTHLEHWENPDVRIPVFFLFVWCCLDRQKMLRCCR